MPKMTQNEFRAKVVEEFIAALQDTEYDWRRGWDPSMLQPKSLSTNRRYNGINRLHLSIIQRNNEWKDPRWMTFNYAKKHGWRIKAGEHASIVENWYPYDPTTKTRIPWNEYYQMEADTIREHRIHLSRDYIYVFNGEQISGIPEYKLPDKNIDQNELVNTLSDEMGVEIKYDSGGDAYYSPSRDEIHLPDRSVFESEYDLSSTSLHELAHATGHPTRLNRDQSGTFGSPEYAYEELIAEMTSVFMGFYTEGDISERHIKNHRAYIGSWAEALRKDPNLLAKAMGEADKASYFMQYKANLITEAEYERLINTSFRVRDDGDEVVQEDPSRNKEIKEVVKPTLDDISLQYDFFTAEFNGMSMESYRNLDMIARAELKELPPDYFDAPERLRESLGLNESKGLEPVDDGPMISIIDKADFDIYNADPVHFKDGLFLYHDGEHYIALDNVSFGEAYTFDNKDVAIMFLEDMGNGIGDYRTYDDYYRVEKYLKEHPLSSTSKARDEILTKPYLALNQVKRVAGNEIRNIYDTLDTYALRGEFKKAVIKNNDHDIEIYYDKANYQKGLPALEVMIDGELAYSDIKKAHYYSPNQAYTEAAKLMGSHNVTADFADIEITQEETITETIETKPELQEPTQVEQVSNIPNTTGEGANTTTTSGNGTYDTKTNDIDYDKLLNEHELLVRDKVMANNAKTTLVINIFGGLGSGKTSLALQIQNSLIQSGYSAIYVDEYAKTEAQTRAKDDDLFDGSINSQLKILQEQTKLLDENIGKYDFVITDAPIMLNHLFLKQPNDRYREFTKALSMQYENFNFALRRPEGYKYSEIGRVHDLMGARDIESKIKAYAQDNKIYTYNRADNLAPRISSNAIKTLERVKYNRDVEKRREETIDRANDSAFKTLRDSINILEYARDQLGFTIEPVGRGGLFTTSQHDSLRIYSNNNSFYRYSNGRGGDIIEFIREFDTDCGADLNQKGDFKIALKKATEYYNKYHPKPLQLNNSYDQYKMSDVVTQFGTQGKDKLVNSIHELGDRMPYNLESPKMPLGVQDAREVYNYLRERCISEDVINSWLDRRILYQDKYKNCVFVGKDFDNNVKSGVIRSTDKNATGANAKRNVKHSVGLVGISYENPNAKDLYVTEAPIDAMSIQTLLGPQSADQSSFLSINSVSNLKALEFYLYTHKTDNLENIYICFDNDTAGIEGAEKANQLLAEVKNRRDEKGNSIGDIDNVEVHIWRPPGVKDFNDYLEQEINGVSMRKNQQAPNLFNIYTNVKGELGDITSSIDDWRLVSSTQYSSNEELKALMDMVKNGKVYKDGTIVTCDDTQNGIKSYRYFNDQFVEVPWFAQKIDERENEMMRRDPSHGLNFSYDM